MANYTVEQACKMIEDCFTPEYLMMEKAIERQHYVDIFTEMHNYISENIVELPFDAEVFTEEDQKDNVETKNVWDKNDKGWSGFWHNVWRVIKNIWRQFWAFVRSIVGQKDYIKPEEGQKIADKAEAVAKDLEQKSEQEVEKAVEENPEPVKEVSKDIKDITVLLKDSLHKVSEIKTKMNDIRTKWQSSKIYNTMTADEKSKGETNITNYETKQLETELEAIIPDLDKIIADPTSFKNKKAIIMILLGRIKAKINSSSVEDENKLANIVKTRLIVAMKLNKLILDIIAFYGKQNSTVQSKIASALNSTTASGLSVVQQSIVYLTNAVDGMISYQTDAIGTYYQATSLTLKTGATVKGQPTVNTTILTKLFTSVSNRVSNINNIITKLITSNNISDIKPEDYKVDYDTTTGECKIGEITEFTAPDLSSSNIHTVIPEIQKIVTTIVDLSGSAAHLMVSLKSKNDRKIASLINDAINKLQSLT